MQGKLIVNKTFHNQNVTELDVSKLLTGIYLLKIQTEDNLETIKLIIQ